MATRCPWTASAVVYLPPLVESSHSDPAREQVLGNFDLLTYIMSFNCIEGRRRKRAGPSFACRGCPTGGSRWWRELVRSQPMRTEHRRGGGSATSFVSRYMTASSATFCSRLRALSLRSSRRAEGEEHRSPPRHDFSSRGLPYFKVAKRCADSASAPGLEFRVEARDRMAGKKNIIYLTKGKETHSVWELKVPQNDAYTALLRRDGLLYVRDNNRSVYMGPAFAEKISARFSYLIQRVGTEPEGPDPRQLAYAVAGADEARHAKHPSFGAL